MVGHCERHGYFYLEASISLRLLERVAGLSISGRPEYSIPTYG